MSRLCLCLARILLAAWVGAAALFVINNVSALGKVPSEVLDVLTVIRFPNYYVFGFFAVSVGLVALLCSIRNSPLPRRRHVLSIILVALALGLMVYDYRQIYLPLEAMITPPGQPRPMEFLTQHNRSKQFNSLHIGLCLLAALTVCWPAVPVASKKDDGTQ
jgi:hypothetical protein